MTTAATTARTRSRTRVAAWIVGGFLLVSSGMAFADDHLVPTLDETADESTNDAAVEDAGDEVGDDQVADDQVAEDEAVADDQVAEDEEVADDESADGEEGDDANHGSVVSEAAQNHEFDEACGNHGAYVSEVARGGDPEDPECAKEDAGGDVAAADADEDGEDVAAGDEVKGKSKERRAKASHGKTKRGQ